MAAHIALYSSICTRPTSSWLSVPIIDVFPAVKDTEQGEGSLLSKPVLSLENLFIVFFLAFLMPCPFLERISFFSRSPITHLTVSSFIDLCSSCSFRLHFLCLFPSPYRRVTLACKHILKLSSSFSLLPVHSILSLMCVLQRVEMTHSLWAVRFTLVLLPI